MGQRSVHIEQLRGDLIQRQIHYQATIKLQKHDVCRVGSFEQRDPPKQLSTSDHYRACSEMHAIQYLLLLQHKNRVRHINLGKLDHLDNAKYGPH